MDKFIAQNAELYAQRYDVRIGNALGSGHHGNVFVGERNANQARFAVKFSKDKDPYLRELRAYEILRERNVIEIEGFWVPRLLGRDDELLTIEMSIVQPPFLLDFGGAYEENRVPDFPENVWTEWREQKMDEFGSRWPVVEDVLSVLRTYGIFMIDIHPRNIVFRNELE